jgi:hypothetical protein
MPKEGSGSVLDILAGGAFDGGSGLVYGLGSNNTTVLKCFQDIDSNSIQGLVASDYTASLSLLK